MASYENTSLWQSSLATQMGDDYEKERERFRTSYESFRTKAGMLANEINRDLPDFTVHDITHLDALWEMASIICGPDYKLNPAEAYVLGGAFLIHDLGMGLAAYPDGIDQLKNTVLWGDSYSYYEKHNNGETHEQLEVKVKELVLRELHAKHAAKLAKISWGSGADAQYLIDDAEIREAYGEVIGLIAHSHWLNTEDLENSFPAALGALGTMPNEWTIEPLKLACIMRAADASHIDGRRAPSFLKLVRKPNAYSAQHWNFQQKLYQPRCEGERLFYSSKNAFMANEASSWWFCRDALQMIDKELNAVDGILSDRGLSRLRAKGVASIGSLDRLKSGIKVSGWDPIDTTVHIGDVAKLVLNIGGQQLYGRRSALIVLRELVQNACDAVRARRVLEEYDENWGLVTVTLGVEDGVNYLEVEDNGVGMSTRVLSGPFLDFGQSFWGTTLMHSEFPSLESKAFESTGHYGIGFFSTFMISEEVFVTTRPYTGARSDTKVLEFKSSLNERPLLRNAKDVEFIKDGGTRIRVNIPSNEIWMSLFKIRPRQEEISSIHDVIEFNCPALDVNIKVVDLDNSHSIFKANSWKTLEGMDFIKRVIGKSNLSNLNGDDVNLLLEASGKIENIIENDAIVGRGFMSPIDIFYRDDFSNYIETGYVSVGGFRTEEIEEMVGILVGKPSSAVRNHAFPICSLQSFQGWIESQEGNILKTNGSNIDLSKASAMIGAGVRPKYIPLALSKKGYLNYSELKEWVSNVGNSIFIVNYYRYHDMVNIYRDIELLDNVLVIKSEYHYFSWVGDEKVWPERFDSEGMLIKSIVGEIFSLLDPRMELEEISDLRIEGEFRGAFAKLDSGIELETDMDIIKWEAKA